MKSMRNLYKTTKKHYGNFIATVDFNSTDIIAYGKTQAELEKN